MNFSYFSKTIFGISVSISLILSLQVKSQEFVSDFWAVDGTVKDIVIEGCEMHVAGAFQGIGTSARGLVLLSETNDNSPLAPTPYFNSNPKIAAPDNNGGWYVGGAFTRVGNVNVPYIVHLHADLTVDENFGCNAFIENSYNEINALVIDENHIYVGGSFALQNGKYNLVRIDKITGRIDESWSPNITPYIANSNSGIKTISIIDDKVIIGGNFSFVNGIQQYNSAIIDKHTAELLPSPSCNGIVYSSIAYDNKILWGSDHGKSWGESANNTIIISNIHTNPTRSSFNNDSINAIISDGNNGWYIYGKFRSWKGFNSPYLVHVDENFNPYTEFVATDINTYTTNRDKKEKLFLKNGFLYTVNYIDSVYQSQKLVRFNAVTGERDASWEVNLNKKNVFDIHVNDTAVFISGDFIQLDTIPKSYLAAISVENASIYEWGPVVNFEISEIEMNNTHLYVYGKFTTIDTLTKRNFARILANGKVDTAFAVTQEAVSQGVMGDMLLQDSLLYIAGDFILKDKNDVTKTTFAAVNIDTEEFSVFSPTDKNYSQTTLSTDINLKVYGDTIFYAHEYLGNISEPNNNFFIAAYNKFTGEKIDWKLNSNSKVEFFDISGNTILLHGSSITLLDCINNTTIIAYNPQTNESEYVATTSGRILDMELLHDNLFIGGDFSQTTGYLNDSIQLIENYKKFISINKNTYNVSSQDYGLSDVARINNISFNKDKLYVSGYISSYDNGMGTIYKNGIICLDTTNFTDQNFYPLINSDEALMYVQDTNILVLGNFTLINVVENVSFATFNICDKSIQPSLFSIAKFGGSINSMASSGDTLYIAGSFKTINGDTSTPDYLCAINKITGVVIADFAPVPNIAIEKIVHKDNRLYVYANGLNKIGGQTVSQIAIIDSKTGAYIDSPTLSAFSSYTSKFVQNFIVHDTLLIMSGSFSPQNPNYYSIAVYDIKNNVIDTLYKPKNFTNIKSMHAKDSLLFFSDTYIEGIFSLDLKTDTVTNWEPEYYGIPSEIIDYDNIIYFAGGKMKDSYGNYTNLLQISGSPVIDDTIIHSYPMYYPNINNISALAYDGEYIAYAIQNTDGSGGIGLIEQKSNTYRAEVVYYSPQAKGNKGEINVRIQGKAFKQGTQFYLQTDTSTHYPSNITNIKGRELYGNISVDNLALGFYDLVVVVPDDTTIVIKNAIELEEFVDFNLWAQIIGPENVVLNRPTTYTLAYGNKSNVDAVGVPIYVVVPKGAASIESSKKLYYKNNLTLDYDSIPDMFTVEGEFMGMPGDFDVFYVIVPYIPANTTGTSKLIITSTSSNFYDIQVFIKNPILETVFLKGLSSSFFDCLGDAIDIVTDVIPVVSDIKGGYEDVQELYAEYKKGGASNLLVSGSKKLAEAVVDAIPIVGDAKSVVEIIDKVHTSATTGGCKEYTKDFWPPNHAITSTPSWSWDPNEKYGPKGAQGSKVVNSTNPFVYMITYENADTALIAAQRVIVVDTLNTNMFDISTFKFLDVGFADTIVDISEIYYDNKTIVDMRPARDMIVEIQFDLDTINAIATWVFKAIDPTTMLLTEDVFGGFLNPNITSPEGEGFVTYYVSVNEKISDNDTVQNDAVIIFDWNKPIWTPEWQNIIDNTPPVSSISALPDSVNKEFRVSWSGTDNISGIALYNVFVAVGNSTEYSLWIQATSATDSLFVGEYGETYKFFCVAVDSAYNYESHKITYEAITQVKQEPVIIVPPNNLTQHDKSKLQLNISPNPCSTKALITYTVPKAGFVTIDLYTNTGYRIMNIESGIQHDGSHALHKNFSLLESGVYVLVLTFNGYSLSKELIIQ